MLSNPDELRAAQRVREQMLQQRVTPEMAELLDEYAQTWPTMTAQAAVGLASQGLAPDSDMARKVAEAEGLELLGETRDHRGFFTKARDTVLGALGVGFGATGDAAGGAVKTATRSAYTLYDTLQQEMVKRPLRALAYASDQASDQGGFDTGEFFGSINEGMDLSGRSAGTIARDKFFENPLQTGKSLLTGGEDTLGSGFLPAGALGEAADYEQSQIQIGGAGADFGDLVATSFLEPDSPEHERWSGILQLGFDIGSDPGGAATGAITKVKAAGKLLGETRNLGFGVHVGNRLDDAGALKKGLVFGDGRNTVLPEVVKAYTRSDEFAPIADRILDPNSTTYDIFHAFKGKLDPSQVRFLRESANREELATKIDNLIGGGESVLAPQKFKLRPASEPSRWRSILPTDTVDLKMGRRNAATQLDRALVAAKVDRGERARILDRWADIPSLGTPAGRAGAQDIVFDGFKSIEKTLIDNGTDGLIAGALTNVYGRVADDTKYVLDTLADNPLTASAQNRIAISGEVDNPDLRLVSELVQEIPLPNIREISLEMTGGAMNSKLFKSAYQAELATSQAVLKAWVPLQLLRGAWTVRVVGEEQVRMAVSGMDSLFRHPGSFIAWAIGRKGTDDMLGEGFAATDEAGQFLDVQFDDAMANTFDAWFKPSAGKVASGHYQVTKPGEVGHWNNVTHQLRMLHNDPVVRRLARGDTPDDIVDHLLSDEGKRVLDDIASQFDPEVGERFIADRGAIRAYVDGFARQTLSETTGGNEALLRLVASGELDGIGFKKAAQIGSDRSKLTRKVRAALGDDNAPPLAAGPKLEDAGISSRLDQLVDYGMTQLMGRPTNYLSRSPTFRQAYWERARELMGAATKDVQDEIIRNAAETFGARSKEMKALIKAAGSGPGDMVDDIRQFDNAAKAHALEFTKDTLYDQARRTQWVDLTRGIFVFAEAWKEIATTWGRMVAKQPNILRRAGQGIEGLRDAGVFYTDPMSGDEMFTYPAGGWAAKILGGVGAVLPGDQFEPIPFETDPEFGEVGMRQTAQVQSLNLFAGSVMPGVGPVVSVAAAQLIPDIPDADWLKDALFPFGSEDEEGSPGDVIESGMPSYLVKLWQGWKEGQIDRDQYGNARFDVIRALSMMDTERYGGPDGQQRAWEDSRGITNNIFAIRGTEQFLGAPAAPRVEFFARDMSGEAFNFAALTKAYFDIFEEKGGDHAEATREFIDRFGVNPDLLRQGKTRSVNKRAITDPGAEWEREHQEIADKHRAVIGFFAPEDFDAQLDSQAFERAVASGDREQLTPEVMIKLANQRTGYIAFNEAVRRLEEAGVGGGDLAEAKRQLKTVIGEQYPGFGETIPVKGRLKPTEAIPKLRAALEEPAVAETPQGKALAQYLQARDAFLEAAKKQFGVSTLSGKKVMPYRQALVEIAGALVSEYEGFGSVWDEVLSREIKADELEDGS